MRKPFHPILFAAFPVLFLFRQNLWGLRYSEILLPLGGTLVPFAIVQLVLSAVTRSPRKAAIVTTTLAVLFLSYGHVWRLIAGDDRRRWVSAEVVVGALWIALLVIVVVAVVRTKRTLADATRVLNVFAIAMLATVAIPLAVTIATGGVPASAQASDAPRIDGGRAPETKRDIYYLVFDRYAGARSLNELFGFENREFLGGLERRGFEVADAARANYQATVPSLAASLNVSYLDWLQESVQRAERESAVPFYDAIGNSEVVRYLQDQGYRYIHVGSRWDMTRTSPSANVNIRLDDISEFTRVFLGSTALLPMMQHGGLLPAASDSTEMARKLTLRQIDTVKKTKTMRGPKVVFSHFGLPHPPYVFDRNGNPVDDKETTVAGKARAYFEQLLYTNQRITEIVDHLLDVPPDERPIIVLQADEGPYPSFGWQTPLHWWKTTDRKLRTKFDILMATHMPGVEVTGTYESMSPVNVFRTVLNAYFETDLEILPDRSFVPYERGIHYDWVEITDRLGEPKDAPKQPLYPPRVPALPTVRRET